MIKSPIPNLMAYHKPFEPWKMPGCILWLRGDVVVLNGGNVSQWTDVSGNGRHATQGTSAQQIPYEISGFGGRPCLHTNQTQFLSLPDLSVIGMSAGHLFVAISADGDPAGNAGSDGNIWQMGPGATSFYPWQDGTIYEQAMSSVRQTTVNPTPALTDRHIYEIVSQAGEFTTRLDGAQLFTTATNTFAMSNAPKLGGIATTNGSKARFAEFGLFNRKLNQTEAGRVRRYLGNKYRINVL